MHLYTSSSTELVIIRVIFDCGSNDFVMNRSAVANHFPGVCYSSSLLVPSFGLITDLHAEGKVRAGIIDKALYFDRAGKFI